MLLAHTHNEQYNEENEEEKLIKLTLLKAFCYQSPSNFIISIDLPLLQFSTFNQLLVMCFSPLFFSIPINVSDSEQVLC